MARAKKTAFGYDVGRRFGELLLKRRRSLGMSQEKLAELAGVDRTYIQLLEKGTSTPGLDIFLRLTQALKLNCGDVANKIESQVQGRETSSVAKRSRRRESG
jgi:transcriptional regulator with XRE-family HTH domain